MASQLDAPAAVLLPWPRELRWGDGRLLLHSAGFEADDYFPGSPRMLLALQQAGAQVAERSRLSLTAQPATRVSIKVQRDAGRYPGLDTDESYRLVVSAVGISIQAETEFGAIRALATLPQLVSPEGELPWVQITDEPRFSWRGLLLDCARHFLSVDSLERALRAMALVKLNVLHLHLSDDQAFRFPSTAFPKLCSEQHYSRQQLAALVELAADLGIRIVPELDMPGHVTSWLVAYPQWGSQKVLATRRFGVHPACLDPTREEVFEAIDQLLGEVADIFPDPCIHIGGDEVKPDWWSNDPQIAAFMQERSMSEVRDLQAYFNVRVGKLVESHGRQVVAWDEVLHPTLPTSWLVQAWRGVTARDQLLQHGNRVLMSSPYYLDLLYPMDSYYQFDPAAPQSQLLALEDAMLEDPRLKHVADGMRWTRQWRAGMVDLQQQHQAAQLVGAEACLWGELVDDHVLDQRLWSRLPGLAERFWSVVDVAMTCSLYERAADFRQRSLPACGIDLAAQLQADLSALGLDGHWGEIARLLEPVKWYGRLLGEQALAARIAGSEMPQARPYDADVPLTTLADVLPPESLQWRQIEVWLFEPGNKLLKQLLQSWRDAAVAPTPPAALAPLLQLLAVLADLIDARLAGVAAQQATVAEVMAPRGELMLPLSPVLCHWLLNAK